jgi:carotenoid cleavage dioxygenase-like enzyme
MHLPQPCLHTPAPLRTHPPHSAHPRPTPQALWKVSVDPSLGVAAPLSPETIAAATTTELWAGAPGQVVQEPVFVARPGSCEEDDGWLLVMVFDGAAVKSELAIFDAQKVSEGPVARVKLPHHVPLGLHGSFCREVLLPGDEQYMSAPQQYDIRRGV